MRKRVGERLLSSTPPLYTFCSSGVHGLATSATGGREQDTGQEEVKELGGGEEVKVTNHPLW